nr:PD-(D/E)XK nuclease family protein [Ezakiella coagulans]
MEKFLYNLKLIYNKYKVMDSLKSDFNVFDLIINPYDEVHLHSRMIYSILTERKFQKQFLMSFLNSIDVSLPEDFSFSDFKNISVEKEKAFSNGRVDLFISFKIKNIYYNVLIENKLLACDQPEQINRYLSYMNSFPNANNYVCYLTLDGSAPSEDSTKRLNEIKLISYDSEIMSWIEDCIKIASREPGVREVLIQYSSLLEKLTGKDVDFIMELKEYLLEDPENFIIANSMIPAVNDAKAELQLRFWTKLEKSLDLMFENFPDINYKKMNINKDLGNLHQFYTKSEVNDLYKIRNSGCYGINYSLDATKYIGDVLFRVEYNKSDGVFYGLKNLEEKKMDENPDEYKIFSEKFKPKEFKTSPWWFVWKYINLNGKRFNFLNMDKDLSYLLFDESKLDDFIKSITSEIKSFIHLIIE